ncbi:MAG: hypothetical protein ABIJ21_09545 [Nanoarchaeota archaeon]
MIVVVIHLKTFSEQFVKIAEPMQKIRALLKQWHDLAQEMNETPGGKRYAQQSGRYYAIIIAFLDEATAQFNSHMNLYQKDPAAATNSEIGIMKSIVEKVIEMNKDINLWSRFTRDMSSQIDQYTVERTADCFYKIKIEVDSLFVTVLELGGLPGTALVQAVDDVRKRIVQHNQEMMQNKNQPAPQ